MKNRLLGIFLAIATPAISFVSSIERNFKRPTTRITVYEQTVGSLISLCVLLASGLVVLVIQTTGLYQSEYHSSIIFELSVILPRLWAPVMAITITLGALQMFWYWGRLALSCDFSSFQNIRRGLGLTFMLCGGCGAFILGAMWLIQHDNNALIPLVLYVIPPTLNWAGAMLMIIAVEALAIDCLLMRFGYCPIIDEF